MFFLLIHGRTTSKHLRPDSDEVLGPNAKCPMRGCGARCKVYTVRAYYHMYFIPMCPIGDPRPVVQCSRCQAMFDLDKYQNIQRAATVPATAPEEVGVVDMLLRRSENEAAERKARALLQKDPNNINLMCYLNVALNGLGRAAEADKVASSVVYHWQTHCRSSWIANGRPKELAAFPRVMMNQATSDYRLEARQFFEPERISDESIAVYKILAYPRVSTSTATFEKPHVESNKRLFKLIQTGKFFVLSEILPSGTINVVISYTDQQATDIRKVTADVASFLAMPVAKAEAIPEGADGGVVSEMESLTAKTTPILL
jgi:hypothetical protein